MRCGGKVYLFGLPEVARTHDLDGSGLNCIALHCTALRCINSKEGSGSLLGYDHIHGMMPGKWGFWQRKHCIAYDEPIESIDDGNFEKWFLCSFHIMVRLA